MTHSTKKNWLNALIPARFQQPVVPDPASLAADPAAIPLEWEQKEAIRDTYASGTEYFLFTGDIDPRRHHLMVLLKAFSQFKKWQHSGMKLIIAGKTTKRTAELITKLDTYKYKQDVLIIQDPEQSTIIPLIAGSYAMIYLDEKDAFPVNILNALQSMVPVIVGRTPEIEKIMQENGILVSPDSEEELAKKLLLLYKDEKFRSSLINKSKTYFSHR